MLATTVAPGHWLRDDAAASYARTRAHGAPAGITSAGRDAAKQIELFTARYRVQWVGRGPYGDVRWWQGRRYVRHSSAGMVAVPGTSRHESGLALDLPNTGARMWFTIHAADHGWRRTIPSEPWHFEYDPTRDRYRDTKTKPTPPTWTPAPTSEEDTMICLRQSETGPGEGRVTLLTGGRAIPIPTPADYAALQAAKVPVAGVTRAFYELVTAGGAR